MQAISIDGSEAIFINTSSLGTGQQAIQIITASSPNQIVRAQSVQTGTSTSAGGSTQQQPQQQPATSTSAGGSTQQQQQQQQQQATTQVIQSTIPGLPSNVQYAQIASGQAVTVARQGQSLVQTLQLPISAVQQTIPVQIPIQNSNGQTVLQTIHLPLGTIQALGGTVTAQVLPQMSQVQVATSGQLVAQSGQQQQQQQQTTGQNNIKQEPGLDGTTQVNTSQANTTTTAQPAVLATVQMPNGQVGQLVAASPQLAQAQQAQIWPANAINIAGKFFPRSRTIVTHPVDFSSRNSTTTNTSTRNTQPER